MNAVLLLHYLARSSDPHDRELAAHRAHLQATAVRPGAARRTAARALIAIGLRLAGTQVLDPRFAPLAPAGTR